jgi:hypothetical protein
MPFTTKLFLIALLIEAKVLCGLLAYEEDGL